MHGFLLISLDILLERGYNTNKKGVDPMKIYQNITELVGNTPLLQISRFAKAYDAPASLLAKLEYLNPAGSVKDRVALAMLEDAERRGTLTPDAVIIEPTSGNTGIGLAAMAAFKGYRVILTMPETMSMDVTDNLKCKKGGKPWNTLEYP